MKLDKNYKVRVTPEQSRQIQELAFELGFEWYFSGKQILHAEICNLVLNNNYMVLSYFENNKKFYADTMFAEISADDLIALLTDLSKSAETPLQNIELTPEFEAVEPTFKVGDPVYFPRLSNKLCVIGEGQEDDYVDEVNGSKALAEMQSDLDFVYDQKTKSWLWDEKDCAPQLLYATPENHALLSKLYPHIKFEAPPKPLTGSDLARAMLDKGWKYVPCYISDSSDTHALERQTRNTAVIIGTHKDHPSFFIYGSGKSFIYYAVPFDPRTGEPLTQAVLDE